MGKRSCDCRETKWKVTHLLRPSNNALKREHLQLPTAEEIFSQTSGACFFSKLDTSSGYWKIKVDKEDSRLLVFGTPLGCCCFKRLPSRIPFTQSTTTKKYTVTQNIKLKLPEIAPKPTVRGRTDQQNLWDRKGFIVSENNRPRSYEIFNERGNILAGNPSHLIPKTEKFNIKRDCDNAIPVSNISAHLNLMIDKHHEKPALEGVYKTKSRRIVQKPKRYIDEM